MLIPKFSKNQSGFTLIEILFYMLFIVVVLGGSIAIVYEILRNNYIVREGIALEEEGNFILRKVWWTLNDVQTINHPTPNTPASYLSVDKYGFAENPIVIDLDSRAVRIKNGNQSPVVLSADRFVISSLSFEFIRKGTPPTQTDLIRLSFFINGKPFKLTRYIR